MIAFWTPAKVLGAAVALRGALLLYGLVQDAYSPLKYTDIDYMVFTDAARNVARGASPYGRETYRYTPLLAWLLYPTSWPGVAWFSAGKVLFGAADVLAGWLLFCILRADMPAPRALRFASVWLLNPMVAQISTRGSSEGLLGAMVVGLLWAVLRRRAALAGALLGLAVHFKIYPFIYAPAVVLHLAPPPPAGSTCLSLGFVRGLLNRQSLTLAAVALATFAALSAAMYAAYGTPFLEDTYLYHLTRIDHRHNFSLYNTLLYASSAAAASPDQAAAAAAAPWLRIESLAFVPQLALSAVLIPLVLARRDLAGSMLAQTYAFVALNKVCTSQYFLWYLVLLPLYLPRSTFIARPGIGLAALGAWVSMQVLWLYEGYKLEFLGQSTFVPRLWMAELAFYALNMDFLRTIIADVGAARAKTT